MYAFLAIQKEHETIIKIITEATVVDSKQVALSSNPYVQSLADAMIELSHENNLFHNDIQRIGLNIGNIEAIGYDTHELLKSDLEATFGFEAIVQSDYEALLNRLIQ
ncbi:hypothetical protein [Staphylococcus edaphicus]|uniref:Uncharacterized protein n=1 Tax=Staphylococcus edaphicus TaxID=1955013 RepID=A0A2C6WL02_9STAP|nr:hypothetical protein [Staphylococcus edaphicus]PHK48474.1 hypothetical protein BTJ66_13345 [Staphylococcus edaphicus]UQW81483.1 hypothetical protein MNY58_13160 [Staphylococcus edaphicus]